MELGKGIPPLVVAEIGINHNGDAALARKMIESAAENGADAVKLQTFIGEELVSKNETIDDPGRPGSRIPLYEFFKRFELTRSEYADLFALARKRGLCLFSAPFDEASLDLLVDLECPAFKIASPDLTYYPFLRRVAQTGKPVVLSTGTGSMEEIERALAVIRKEGNDRIVLLHCVSSYPAEHADMHLTCLPALAERFRVPVGLSDHSRDNVSALVAAVLGACMIEKHFTLDRSLPGVDQPLSMEPGELRQLKRDLAAAVTTLGDGEKHMRPSEAGVKRSARRSLVARIDIEPGTTISPQMVAIKRPGTGIPPEDLEKVLGKKAREKIAAESLFSWGQLE